MEQSQVASSSTLTDVPTVATIDYLHIVAPRLDAYVPTDPSDDTISFLENTYKYLPQDGQHNLASDIDGCCSDEELRQLAENIDTALLRPIKALGGKTEPVTPSPQFGGEDSIDNLLGTIDDPIVREQKRLWVECLKRDGNSCVLTHIYDENVKPRPSRRILGALEAAHIIPFSLGNCNTEAERQQIGTIWNTMYRYFPSVRSRLSFGYESLNDVSNVMMLLGPLHGYFGAFKLALEPTAVSNQYRIKRFFNLDSSASYPWYYHFLPDDDLVTFTSHDHRYPLPNRILLETHFLIASVLHATGRGELVEEIQRDYGDTGALAKDGSTDIASLLSITGLCPPNRCSTQASGNTVSC